VTSSWVIAVHTFRKSVRIDVSPELRSVVSRLTPSVQARPYDRASELLAVADSGFILALPQLGKVDVGLDGGFVLAVSGAMMDFRELQAGLLRRHKLFGIKVPTDRILSELF